LQDGDLVRSNNERQDNLKIIHVNFICHSSNRHLVPLRSLSFTETKRQHTDVSQLVESCGARAEMRTLDVAMLVAALPACERLVESDAGLNLTSFLAFYGKSGAKVT
jgi:hypothetical protein